ncbi:hypothetical protein BaRGS_00014778 [Batillaria attramentaria]|uniref:EGF-like domain-containing protein n=1 Tax=Batillaria attramentaria TaxID=370345 RepID=A0ABD0L3Q7_9CAEN
MHEDSRKAENSDEMTCLDLELRLLNQKHIPTKRKMKMKVLSLCVTLVIFLLLASVADAKKKRGPQCSVCKEIADNFHKGIERTKKSGYGGGNTDWEEKSLGQYANSEVRLVEIVETLCLGETKECHLLLEEHEELVEEFWFKSGLEKQKEPFFNYFCIEQVKACCPNNTFGSDCKQCTGGTERPCKGNGVCDGGGTREGTGKCKCHVGYQGKLCDECAPGYFEDMRNDTHTVCKVCHISCKNSCSEDGPKGCDECKEGWREDEELGCQDINECEQQQQCKEDQYCTNTLGSYTCLSCNSACTGCSGHGPDKCTTCNEGYELNGTTCVDVNECEGEAGAILCKEANETCQNIPGSYKCVCPSGFERKGSGCEKIQKVKKEKKAGKDSKLNRKEAEILITIFFLMAIIIMFSVVSKVLYHISPFLISIPVVALAGFVYLLASQYD